MKTFKYQNKKKKNYFEGYYTRLFNDKMNIAIIFALTKNESDPHAFIQIFDGVKGTNTYYRFAVSDFKSISDTKVQIANNILSINKVELFLEENHVQVELTNQLLPKKHLFFQSAMSYLSLFPLVCYQEVVFMDGNFKGSVHGKKQTGKMYMEKTYGYKFPNKWIWCQANNFEKKSYLSLSVGHIPLFGKYRKGFFAMVMYEGKSIRFGSYNFSKVSISQKDKLLLLFTKRKYKLEVKATLQDPVKLVGPSQKALMNLDVFESITSIVTYRLYHKEALIMEDVSDLVGLENMY